MVNLIKLFMILLANDEDDDEYGMMKVLDFNN